jgi:hypothetical protein
MFIADHSRIARHPDLISFHQWGWRFQCLTSFDEAVADASPSGVREFGIAVSVGESQKTRRLALLVARYPAPIRTG